MDAPLFSLSLLSGWGPLAVGAMKPVQNHGSLHFSGKGLQEWSGLSQVSG